MWCSCKWFYAGNNDFHQHETHRKASVTSSECSISQRRLKHFRWYSGISFCTVAQAYSNVIFNNDQLSQSTANHLDACLAWWRTMLIKKYKNDQNKGLMYITLSGNALPLTPTVVLDWACAMVCTLYVLRLKHTNYMTIGGRAGIIEYATKHPIIWSWKLGTICTSSMKGTSLEHCQFPVQNSAMPNINLITSIILLQTLANLFQSTGPPQGSFKLLLWIHQLPQQHLFIVHQSDPPHLQVCHPLSSCGVSNMQDRASYCQCDCIWATCSAAYCPRYSCWNWWQDTHCWNRNPDERYHLCANWTSLGVAPGREASKTEMEWSTSG